MWKGPVSSRPSAEEKVEAVARGRQLVLRVLSRKEARVGNHLRVNGAEEAVAEEGAEGAIVETI